MNEQLQKPHFHHSDRSPTQSCVSRYSWIWGDLPDLNNETGGVCADTHQGSWIWWQPELCSSSRWFESQLSIWRYRRERFIGIMRQGKFNWRASHSCSMNTHLCKELVETTGLCKDNNNNDDNNNDKIWLSYDTFQKQIWRVFTMEVSVILALQMSNRRHRGMQWFVQDPIGKSSLGILS